MDEEIAEYEETVGHYEDADRERDAASGRRQRPRPSKANKGARFLVVLLRAVVMAAALFFFFLFAGIAAIVLFHLFVAGRSLRRRRRRAGGAGESKEVGGAGLSPEELRRLPASRFSGRGRVGSGDCAVCLEGMRVGERCRVLQGCGHGFHKGCVDKWLVRVPACPVCRKGVRAAEF